MTAVAILFWLCALLVFYTYLGYGMVLGGLVRLREALRPRTIHPSGETPEVTLLIAAYDEQEVVDAKMANCRALDYPQGKLRIVWITDGSTDRTVQRLSAYPEVTVLHEAARRGKTAAVNRAMQHIATPVVVLTDANTMLNPEAIRALVAPFADPKVGCVAGEKRVAADSGAGAAATEGLYWRYESKLKEWDARLATAVGAAGELYAIRRDLFEPLPEDTLLDDFVLSMRIVGRGYRIAYRPDAYAVEPPSAAIAEEGKRKRRIAAGGLQASWRLRRLADPLRYGTAAFQFVSHRVLRWTLTPVALAALLPLNIVLLWSPHPGLYGAVLALQALFYLAAAAGWARARSGKGGGLLSVPYYFLFMNWNVFRGAAYLASHRGAGTWEKARRSG